MYVCIYEESRRRSVALTNTIYKAITFCLEMPGPLLGLSIVTGIALSIE